MANKSSPMDVQKITVALPKKLLERLDEHVAPRRRARFIVEAIEERLALEEQVAVLDEAAGAWTDENHPEMLTDQDVERWLDDLRRSWSPAGAPSHG
jgi:Arc/MetJ-type ribon-helix-helix transcriptional regulator